MMKQHKLMSNNVHLDDLLDQFQRDILTKVEGYTGENEGVWVGVREPDKLYNKN
jgi:hypothetical protein